MKPGYYTKHSQTHPQRDEHVISYTVFKTLSVYKVLQTLTHMGLRPTKREKK